MTKTMSLATDLRRVSYFLQNNEHDLAEKFLVRGNRLYGLEPEAEMAMTASVVLASNI